MYNYYIAENKKKLEQEKQRIEKKENYYKEKRKSKCVLIKQYRDDKCII